MKAIIRRLLGRAGWRLSRPPANRFQAMDEALALLKQRGYEPRVIIDAGANDGTWSRMTRALFPAARFHLIEPQPACSAALHEQARRFGRTQVHEVAVSTPGVRSVRMVDAGSGSTGAWVADPLEARGRDVLELPASTLDALLADDVALADRALLKLDLEGHEIDALTGAAGLLASVEVVLTEVRFYPIDGGARPIFRDVVAFMHGAGFELYDFAALSSRFRDLRLRLGDVIFVRRGSELLRDTAWS